MHNSHPTTHLDHATVELVGKLRNGERQLAESFINRPEFVDDPNAALEIIYREYVELDRLGESPDAAEFYARFPDYESRLTRLLAIDRLLDTDSPGDTDGGDQSQDGDLADEQEAADSVPDRVGRYRIESKIGQGAMGVVYRAIQPGTGRMVALKVLHASKADSRHRQRFLTEAHTSARLDHPGIVQIFEADSDGETDFIAMELVDGSTLQDESNESWNPREAASLIEQIARAVTVAHHLGIVHRDLKPSNILLKNPNANESSEAFSRIAKVADFGLAKSLEDQHESLTRTGDVVGTPLYMAPEQAEGNSDKVGPASDVYSLGAILYELLTGRAPFEGSTTLGTLQQICQQAPILPSRLRSEIPRDLETVCLKCLEKDHTQRYETAAELADDLRQFLDGYAVSARRVGSWQHLWRRVKRHPVFSAACVLTCFSIAGIVWWSADQARQRHELVAEVKAKDKESRAKGVEVKRVRGQADSLREKLTKKTTEANTTFKRALLMLRNYRGTVDQVRGMPQMDEPGRRAYEQALRHFEELLVEQGNSTELQYQTAITAVKVGSLNHLLGDWVASEEAFRRAVELSRTMRKSESDEHAEISRRLEANACRLLGYLLKDIPDRQSEAAEVFTKAIELYRAVPDAQLSINDRITVANIMMNRAVVVSPDQRRSIFHEVLTIQTSAMYATLGAKNELQEILDDQPDHTDARASQSAPAKAPIHVKPPIRVKPPRIVVPKQDVSRTPGKTEASAKKNPNADSPKNQSSQTGTPSKGNSIGKAYRAFKKAAKSRKDNQKQSDFGPIRVTPSPKLDSIVRDLLDSGLDEGIAELPSKSKNRDKAWLALEIGLTMDGLGDIATREKNYKEAEYRLDQAVRLWKIAVENQSSSGDYAYYLARGIGHQAKLFHETQRLKRAQAASREAIKLLEPLVEQYSDRVYIRYNLGVYQDYLGRILQDDNNPAAAANSYLDAVKHFRNLFARNPDNPFYMRRLSFSLSRLGEINRARGDYEKAVSYLLQSRYVDPSSSLAINMAAWTILTTVRDDEWTHIEALKLAEHVIALEPENVNYLNTLGLARYRNGDLKGARESIEQAIKLQGRPNGYDAAIMSMIESDEQRPEVAKRWLALSSSLAYTHSQAANAQETVAKGLSLIKQAKIPASIQALIGKAVKPLPKTPVPDDFKTLHAEATAKVTAATKPSPPPPSTD
jgi:tetratricopeptide (TPR) repeat protein